MKKKKADNIVYFDEIDHHTLPIDGFSEDSSDLEKLNSKEPRYSNISYSWDSCNLSLIGLRIIPCSVTNLIDKFYANELLYDICHCDFSPRKYTRKFLKEKYSDRISKIIKKYKELDEEKYTIITEPDELEQSILNVVYRLYSRLSR